MLCDERMALLTRDTLLPRLLSFFTTPDLRPTTPPPLTCLGVLVLFLRTGTIQYHDLVLVLILLSDTYITTCHITRGSTEK